ncbi:hypothetical protein AArc1_1661 [Natrarchaeobaculum sulfurireducens]|uniref:Uncharacterized protein n=1 Tax=Natrarchaeobaculum sulfurireducens TaxID=2044521 RepID=A0A346PEP6_9EURY|nr:hypothetical protein AArc1_1661 [Natrarchaeobaculum sulfurireducens]
MQVQPTRQSASITIRSWSKPIGGRSSRTATLSAAGTQCLEFHRAADDWDVHQESPRATTPPGSVADSVG